MINSEEITMSVGNNHEDVGLNILGNDQPMEFDTSNQQAGTDNYRKLINKPSINSVTLIDNKTSQDLGLQPEGDYPDESLTNMDIERLLNNFS